MRLVAVSHVFGRRGKWGVVFTQGLFKDAYYSVPGIVWKICLTRHSGITKMLEEPFLYDSNKSSRAPEFFSLTEL
jgi:hypothetical protein